MGQNRDQGRSPGSGRSVQWIDGSLTLVKEGEQLEKKRAERVETKRKESETNPESRGEKV